MKKIILLKLHLALNNKIYYKEQTALTRASYKLREQHVAA